MNALELKNVEKSFKKRRGEVVGILGPNRSGKSTLVRVISTLVYPDAGSVEVFGVDAVRHPKEVQRGMNRVSVEASFFKKLSAMENLLYGAKLYGAGAKDDLYGFDGVDLLKGGPGKDKLNEGDGHSDELYGGGGDDLLKDGETEFRWMLSGDTMLGEAGNDTLVGKYGRNHLLGGDGNDTLMGGYEDDNLLGGTGDDLLGGGGGGDLYLFAAGWGQDTISDDAGVSGTLGNSVSFPYGSDPITADLTVTLIPGPGPEVTDGTNTVEWQEAGAAYSVIGGSGNDTITGDDNRNHLHGGDGADTIAAGDDRVDVSDPHTDTGDDVDCGPGSDTVSVDPGNVDRIANCETVTVGSE